MNSRSEVSREHAWVSCVAWALFGDGVGSLTHAWSIQTWCIVDSEVFVELCDLAVCAGECDFKDGRCVCIIGIGRRSDGRSATVAARSGAVSNRAGLCDGGRRSARADRVVDGRHGGIERVVYDRCRLSICNGGKDKCP